MNHQITVDNPKVVCLQETFLKDKNQLNIKYFFQSYNHLYKDGHRASGDVSILIRKDIPQQQINIDSELQVIAVKTTLHKPVNICYIYMPHDPICYQIAEGFRFMPLSLVRLRTFLAQHMGWLGVRLKQVLTRVQVSLRCHNSPRRYWVKRCG